jgi:Ser/Thr protein kinase RdoA (MazF antagonist)
MAVSLWLIGWPYDLIKRLSELCRIEFKSHWICGDLWRENILVQAAEHRISGIVDFGAARCDWPILEVIRLFASWLTPNDVRWEILTDNFSANFPRHYPISFKQIDQIATVTAWLYWLQWLSSANDATKSETKNAWRRLEELDQRLTQLYGEI